MTETQLVLGHASKVVMLALLAGMIWRGRMRSCWTFAVYIGAALAGNMLATLWPGRFHTPSFWVFKQAVYDLLKVVIGVEIAWRTIAAFPGTWRAARLAFGIVLPLTTLVFAWMTPRASLETMWAWHPSVLTAAVWPLTLTALIVSWYRLPIGEWPRAILLGLALYLLLGVAIRMLQRHGFGFQMAAYADSVIWIVLMCFWAWAAWRRDAPSEARPLDLAVADA